MLCYLTVLFSLTANDPNPSEMLNEAKRLAEKEPARAAELYRKFLDLRPKDARRASVHLNRALCLARLNKHDEAFEAAGHVPAASDYAADARLLQAGSRLAQGKYADAEALLEQWLAANAKHPRHAEASLSRGMALNRLGKFAKAREILRPLTGLGARAWYELAVAEDGMENPIAAAAAFRKAVAEPALSLEARLGLGSALIKSGKYAGAADALAALVKEFPKAPEAHEAAFLAASCHERLGDHKGAAAMYEVALNSPKQEYRAAARLGLAEAARVGQNWDAAVAHYEGLRKEKPSPQLLVLCARGQGYVALGRNKPDKALEFFREAVAVPRNPADEAQAEAALQVGVLLRQMNKPQDAIKALSAAVEYPFANFAAQALLHLSECHEDVSDQSAALASYRKLIVQYPMQERAKKQAEARIYALTGKR